MTTPELALTVIVVALLTMGVAGAYEHHCNRARAVDTSRFLATLNQALLAFQATGAQLPSGADPGVVIRRLQATPASAAVLRSVPADLLGSIDGTVYCVDAWGTPIRFIPADTKVPAQQVRVQLAGGAIFESAGPDRRFGDAPAGATPGAPSGAESDNLGTDDLAIVATLQKPIDPSQ